MNNSSIFFRIGLDIPENSQEKMKKEFPQSKLSKRAKKLLDGVFLDCPPGVTVKVSNFPVKYVMAIIKYCYGRKHADLSAAHIDNEKRTCNLIFITRDP